MHKLFSDRKKFRLQDKDPTNSRLTSVQNYIRNIHKRGEINESDYKKVYPKSAKIARAYGTAKIHKTYDNIPSFRPMIDTIDSTHYLIGQFISKLLNPLTINNHQLKDSFDAAQRIKAIPNDLYNDGYVLVSFDVVTSTNMLLKIKRTVDITLQEI